MLSKGLPRLFFFLIELTIGIDIDLDIDNSNNDMSIMSFPPKKNKKN